jgi:hypothetical protein
MYQNDTNEYGCPLRDQTGGAGVQNFDAIVARLAPDLRAAFEAERTACQAELERYLAASAHANANYKPGDLDAGNLDLTNLRALLTQFQQLLNKRGQPRLHELIESLLPGIVVQLNKVGQPRLRELIESLLPRIAVQ